MPGSPDRRPPRILLVTDSARLVPGGTRADRAAALERQARAAFAAGVDAVQLREPQLDAATLYALARALAGAGRVIITDRADVAVAAGASGLHLRGDGPPPARVRDLIGPSMTLSRAVHTEDEAARARREGGLDWVVAGTAFASESKPGRAPLGAQGLAAIVAAAGMPVVAIGGIGPATAAAAWAAGVSGIAAIGVFLADFGPEHVDRLRRGY